MPKYRLLSDQRDVEVRGNTILPARDGTFDVALGSAEEQAIREIGGILVDPEGGYPLHTMARVNRRRTQVPFKIHGFLQNSAGTLGNTMHATYIVPFPFLSVRAYVENMAATAQINRLLSVAVSDGTGANDYTPSGAWTPVLFGGTAAHATAVCSSGAGTNSAVPSVLASDRLDLKSVPRANGRDGYMFMVRDFSPAAGNTVANRSDAGSPLLTLDESRVKCWFQTGDFVTNPAGFTAPTEWSMVPAVYFEFTALDGQITFMALGDSTIQGADGGPPLNIYGGGRQAFEAMEGKAGFINQGWTSQPIQPSFDIGLLRLAAHRPSAASFCPWSPNDGDRYTQAGIDRGLRLALRWIDECQKVGTLPILCTPCPVTSITTAEETVRRQCAATTRRIATEMGVPLVDRDRIYTDYSRTFGGWLPGLNATALHPSPAGYALEAATFWTPIISSLR